MNGSPEPRRKSSAAPPSPSPLLPARKNGSWCVSRIPKPQIQTLRAVPRSDDLTHDVLQSQPRNFPNFFKSDFDFLLARVLQPLFKTSENSLLFVQSRADNKRKTEPGLVSLVMSLEGGDFLLSELVQPGADLF